MKKYELSDLVYLELKKIFPNAMCELNFTSDYELMVAVILSAQCTDARVNTVTPILFKKYPTFKDLSRADILDVEEIIKPCGFFHNKAKNIIEASKQVCENFGGKLPNKMEDLITLAGVGRKTANVLLSNVFQTPSIAVDTHVFRVSNRIGLSKSGDVFTCERQLMNSIRKENWSEMHHLLVLFGRYHCKARKPACEKCPLKNVCKEGIKWSGNNLLMEKGTRNTLKN